VSRLERGLENPTVAVLERLAEALGAQIVEFFLIPRRGEAPPQLYVAAGVRRVRNDASGTSRLFGPKVVFGPKRTKVDLGVERLGSGAAAAWPI
jgi:transcriptional regulator with XRE-family HTH domain